MRRIPTHTLLDWYRHPDSHPVTIELARAELMRRGVFPALRKD